MVDSTRVQMGLNVREFGRLRNLENTGHSLRKPQRSSQGTEPDQIEMALTSLSAQLPEPHIFSSREELLVLIQACGGPRTASSIRKSLEHASKSRIPHLFSSIDTQIVVDILANDLDRILAELLPKKARKPGALKKNKKPPV